MAHIGYIRVSSIDQKTSRQLHEVRLDKIFEDKVSGVSDERRALKECLSYIREGDTLHVHNIDRLARNLEDLQRLVRVITGKGVFVHFHKENLIFAAGESNPMQTLMFQMLGAFAQFERSLIRERQREGIAQAKAQGRHLGRPAKLTKAMQQSILSRLDDGYVPSSLAKEFNISVSSIYKLWAKSRNHV